MQFLRIAAVLSLVATGWTEVRAEWFSINNAISQAVLTNPGVGEASANRRATEAELRQTQGGELKLIAPVFVVVGKEDCPACVPADLAGPAGGQKPRLEHCGRRTAGR